MTCARSCRAPTAPRTDRSGLWLPRLQRPVRPLCPHHPADHGRGACPPPGRMWLLRQRKILTGHRAHPLGIRVGASGGAACGLVPGVDFGQIRIVPSRQLKTPWRVRANRSQMQVRARLQVRRYDKSAYEHQSQECSHEGRRQGHRISQPRPAARAGRHQPVLAALPAAGQLGLQGARQVSGARN